MSQFSDGGVLIPPWSGSWGSLTRLVGDEMIEM